MIRYGSVCSGIEAATAAWHPLGWEPAFFSEIEAFPRAVLQHHYTTPVHGDFTTIGADDYGTIDLLVGGTPCQSFSIAGLRGGLDDDRGNLALEFLRLAQRKRPTWLVWENVPGVLSSNGGRDFGSILGGMGELGYGWAYRVLDDQYFGVAQRRRRVFVVGYLGDWRPPAAVLFERHSLQGHPAPRREKRQTAPTLPSRSTAGGGDCDGGLIAECVNFEHGLAPHGSMALSGVAPQITASEQKGHTIVMSSGQANAEIAVDLSPALNCNRDGAPIAFSCKDHGNDAYSDVSPTLRSMNSVDSNQNGGGQVAICFQSNGNTDDILAAGHDVSPTVRGGGQGGNPPAVCITGDVTHALTAKGRDASEDGTGRGNPIVSQPRYSRNGRGAPDTVAGPLTAEAGRTGKGDSAQCVAYSIMPMNSGKDFKARETEVAQPIMTTPVGGNQGGDYVVSMRESGQGYWVEDVVAGTIDANMGQSGHGNRPATIAVAFAQNQRDEVRTMDVAGALAAEPGMKQQTYVACDVADTLSVGANQTTGFRGDIAATNMAVRRLTPVECSRLQQFPDDYLELKYANANEAHAAQILHELWREIGAKGIAAQEANFPQDGSGDVCEKRRIATALFTPEVLLAGVHVGWIQWDQARRSAEHQNITHVGAAGWTDGFVRRLREAGEAGCPPYRRESYQQCASELGYFVQELPLETAQIRSYLQRSELWQEAQGAWTLRYAFATPKEIESGKPLMSDGPRYKALGNSMAVPVMRWIGKRIQMVEALK